ncbi:hypothetical protein GCM10009555_007050 [Acrocarpospora macrocephala]|uniref:HEXXH motif domain-containing protein n=1 Tax=Acrocarpospora macrocephala TaxID=150177 RepID=A0A5M3WY28_9ACTN|nr:HEXXH motif domain-containing protein [Acrocarpospora macrocephala]GES13172.1 hypothetical protein Amac_067690 [Acrocarpospora macrocephala]
MTLTEHRISGQVFSELAAGAGGAAAVALLSAGQHSKHIILVRGVVDTARARNHPAAADARRAYDLLASLQIDHPDAVKSVLCHPAVGAWARQTVKALDSHDSTAAPGQLAALAAAAAIRAGARVDVDVPAVDGLITLPSLGQLLVPGGVRVATFHCRDGSAEAELAGSFIRLPSRTGEDAPGWSGLRTLAAGSPGMGLTVVVDDLDPHRMPGLDNLGGRLSRPETDRWGTVLTQAWDLLVNHHTTVADEVREAISVLTPLVAPPQGTSSSSSRETFGSVALSTPPDATSLAVTLAHETQHAKLSALLDIVRLTEPDDGSRYYAPWREDPRPVSGLLQGSYAFLGVADFWRRQREVARGEESLKANVEFARWRDAASLVADTLIRSGRLTRDGTSFVEGMKGSLGLLAREPIPDQARAVAEAAAKRHRTRWQERNGERRLVD